MKIRWAATLLCLSIATTASALPFDTVIPSGRSAAMGGMQTLTSLGPGTVLGNPAGLVDLTYPGLMVLGRDWYGTDVRSYATAFAQPLGDGGLGFAWHFFGESDIWTENLLALAGAWSLPAPAADGKISFGFTFKALVISAPAYTHFDYAGDQVAKALDLGLRYDVRPDLQLAWVEENLFSEETSLIENGELWRAAQRKQRWGGSYRWRDDLIFGVEYLKRENRKSEWLFGVELGFYDAFLLRGGAGFDYASAGFGLRSKRWQLDTAFESRKSLGTSLIFSLNYALWDRGGER